MKSELICLIAFVVVCNTFSPLTQLTSCQVSLIKSFTQIKNNMDTDGLVEFTKTLPSMLIQCGITNVDTQLTAVCINDLNDGFKILRRIVGETDNKVRLALDLTLFERVFKNKIQKDCTFLSEVNFNLKSNATCLQSAYQLSLTVQNLWQDLGKGNSTAILKDIQTVLDDIPDTLDACGQSQWAFNIRRDFPAECLKSFDDLGKQLLVFEHNYDHLEWVVKHGKDLSKVLGEVRKTCPLFG